MFCSTDDSDGEETSAIQDPDLLKGNVGPDCTLISILGRSVMTSRGWKSERVFLILLGDSGGEWRQEVAGRVRETVAEGVGADEADEEDDEEEDLR